MSWSFIFYDFAWNKEVVFSWSKKNKIYLNLTFKTLNDFKFNIVLYHVSIITIHLGINHQYKCWWYELCFFCNSFISSFSLIPCSLSFQHKIIAFEQSAPLILRSSRSSTFIQRRDYNLFSFTWFAFPVCFNNLCVIRKMS